jgi:hypothetical protein
MVYDALMEAFTIGDTSIPVDNFPYAQKSKKSQINMNVKYTYYVLERYSYIYIACMFLI